MNLENLLDRGYIVEDTANEYQISKGEVRLLKEILSKARFRFEKQKYPKFQEKVISKRLDHLSELGLVINRCGSYIVTNKAREVEYK